MKILGDFLLIIGKLLYSGIIFLCQSHDLGLAALHFLRSIKLRKSKLCQMTEVLVMQEIGLRIVYFFRDLLRHILDDLFALIELLCYPLLLFGSCGFP